MIDAANHYLIDTNILLRLNRPDDTDFLAIRKAIQILSARGSHFCYTPQNIVEFWNACTRPSRRNGYGLSIVDTQKRTQEIERVFKLLESNERIYPEWRRLVETHAVSGVQVHDAHLVAAMRIHGVSYILTLNTRDFMRYPGITVQHPRDIV